MRGAVPVCVSVYPVQLACEHVPCPGVQVRLLDHEYDVPEQTMLRAGQGALQAAACGSCTSASTPWTTRS